ncbi:MAG TPA: arylsulfatase [Acidobacteriaceae bacterium]|jgi:arylsulfatase A-like enzyme|nr:arylsulfatase [Acidobacteriaceae bacterium]
MGKRSEEGNLAAGITRREWLAGAAAAGISMLAPRAMGAEAAGVGAAAKPAGMMPSGPGAAKLNVVYIVADDLGWADVGYHQPSEIRTPHIDKLVGEGVELDRFYGCPVCSPSRACLLTGRSPMRYGMIYEVVRPWQTHGIPQDERVISEAFRDAGYQTWAVGKWHLGLWNRKLIPNGRGFDHFYGFLTGEIDYFQHTREGGLDWQRNGTSERETGYSTDLLAAEAARLIEQRDRSKPFFLYLPFNAPHQPLMAPDDLIRSYAGIEDRQRRTYAAMVTSLDAGIGRVKEALDRSGAGSNTLILFHSDNGGQTKKGAVNHPLRAGKSTVFEGGIRVPGFLHAPGLLAGGRKSQQVLTNLDMFPTLAAAAAVEPGNQQPFDGRNLWSALTAGEVTEREDLFFAIGERDVWQHAVFHGPWKLVLEKKQADFRLNPPDPPEKAMLFRIAEDPYEKNDLADAHVDVVADLTARIRNWCALHPPGDIGLSSERHPGFVAPDEWARCAIL